LTGADTSIARSVAKFGDKNNFRSWKVKNLGTTKLLSLVVSLKPGTYIPLKNKSVNG
jgi:hypothetical protein